MADGYLEAVQAALVGALREDAEVFALIGGRVYDQPRPTVAFPYARVGRIYADEDDLDLMEGSEVVAEVMAYSRPVYGRIGAARIVEAIRKALHRRPDALVREGYCFWDCTVLTWDVEPEEREETFRGQVVVTVRVAPVI